MYYSIHLSKRFHLRYQYMCPNLEFSLFPFLPIPNRCKTNMHTHHHLMSPNLLSSLSFDISHKTHPCEKSSSVLGRAYCWYILCAMMNWSWFWQLEFFKTRIWSHGSWNIVLYSTKVGIYWWCIWHVEVNPHYLIGMIDDLNSCPICFVNTTIYTSCSLQAWRMTPATEHNRSLLECPSKDTLWSVHLIINRRNVKGAVQVLYRESRDYKKLY